MTFSVPAFLLFLILPLTITLLALSITTIALSSISLKYIAANYLKTGILIAPYIPKLQTTFGLLPIHLYRADLKLSLATGALILIFVLLGCLSLALSDDRRSTFARYLPIPLSLLSAILALAAMTTTFVTHNRSSAFPSDILGKEYPSGYYDRGDYDFETWICGLRHQLTTSETRSDAKYQCRRVEVGRWILVPLFVVAMLTVGAAVMAAVAKDRKEDGESLKPMAMKTVDGMGEQAQEGRRERE